MPQVSVIMSVYNAQSEEILRTAIESICSQTFLDFEFIICDDGSTDDTWEKLQKIAATDSRIQLIHNKENRKAGYARNCCIRQASGKYIAVMDADDISDPRRLEIEKEYLDEHRECDFVGTRSQFFIKHIGDDEENYWFCKKPVGENFLFSLPFAHPSCMFRAEALQKVNNYDESKQKIRMEDYDMILRMYEKGLYGENIDQVLYYLRRDENQYKRRKYRYRWNEAKMKYDCFSKLGLMPKAIPYIIKPLIVGLIPWRLSAILQKKYYSRKKL